MYIYPYYFGSHIEFKKNSNPFRISMIHCPRVYVFVNVFTCVSLASVSFIRGAISSKEVVRDAFAVSGVSHEDVDPIRCHPINGSRSSTAWVYPPHPVTATSHHRGTFFSVSGIPTSNLHV